MESCKPCSRSSGLSLDGIVKGWTPEPPRIVACNAVALRSAADVLHEVLMAKTAGMGFDKITDMIHFYPPYGDVVKRPSAYFYGNKLRSSFFIKLLRRLNGSS